jgi:hypothetical protein
MPALTPQQLHRRADQANRAAALAANLEARSTEAALPEGKAPGTTSGTENYGSTEDANNINPREDQSHPSL